MSKIADRMETNKHRAIVLSLLLSLYCCTGCVGTGYRYGVGAIKSSKPSEFRGVPIQVQDGGDHPFVDRLESTFQTPRRYFAEHFSDRPSGPEAESQARQQSLNRTVGYLQNNGLNDMHVDYRRYEPRVQWQRLQANERVAPFWKYTFGTAAVLRSTLLPDRALHRDRYDPFTNTLSINSTDSRRALLQAASAKEYTQHERLGTYAAAQRLPLVGVFHQFDVASDALSYARKHEDWEAEKQLYPAAYGSVARSLGNGWGQVPLVQDTLLDHPIASLALSGIGSLTGRAAAEAEERRRTGDSNDANDSND